MKPYLLLYKIASILGNERLISTLNFIYEADNILLYYD